MAPKLKRSPRALSTLKKFYRKTWVVYVEGADDVQFWKHIFRLHGIESVKFNVAGGKLNLKAYISDIVQQGADIIVAMDSDYTPYTEDKIDNRNIIYTYGYSIENTIYRTGAINNVLRLLTKTEEDFSNDIDDWKINFSKDVIKLISSDIFCIRERNGVKPLGDTSARFLKEEKPHFICLQKRDNHIKNPNLPIEAINNIEKEIASDKRHEWFLIRGHFLYNAVDNFIRQKRKAVTNKKAGGIATDILYSLLITQINEWSETDDDEYIHYQLAIHNLQE